MTARAFAYWLQGYFELAEPKELTPDQLKIVKNHLNMVFKHEIDPEIEKTTPASILNHLHDGKPNARC